MYHQAEGDGCGNDPQDTLTAADSTGATGATEFATEKMKLPNTGLE